MFSFKSSQRWCSVKKVFVKISQISQENTCGSLFLIKMYVFRPATLLKESQTKAFYCEICEIFKNIYFEQYMRTTESVVSFSWHLCQSLFLINLQVFIPAPLLKRDSNTGVFPVKFVKLLRTPILKNIFERLLLQFLSHATCVRVSS